MIEFAVTFSPGAELDVNMGQVIEVLATEERTVELSMPSGNQVILPTSSKGMRKVTIQKPDTLLSENIKKDVVIGGVTGALLAPPTGPYSIRPSTVLVECLLLNFEEQLFQSMRSLIWRN